MDYAVVGFIIKLIGLVGLWAIGACMLYRNEMERPRHERVAERTTVKFIAALWPAWIIGLFGAGVSYILYRMVGGVAYGVSRFILYFTKSKSDEHNRTF
jgi:hypothetical protein